VAVVTGLNVPPSMTAAFDASLRLQYKEYYGRVEIGLKPNSTPSLSKLNRNIDNEQRSKAVDAIAKLIRPDKPLQFRKTLNDELFNGVLNPSIFTLVDFMQRTEQLVTVLYYPYYDQGPPGWNDPYTPVQYEEFLDVQPNDSHDIPADDWFYPTCELQAYLGFGYSGDYYIRQVRYVHQLPEYISSTKKSVIVVVVKNLINFNFQTYILQKQLSVKITNDLMNRNMSNDPYYFKPLLGLRPGEEVVRRCVFEPGSESYYPIEFVSIRTCVNDEWFYTTGPCNLLYTGIALVPSFCYTLYPRNGCYLFNRPEIQVGVLWQR
jgi:hypothetical protein